MLQLSLRITTINLIALLFTYWLANNVVWSVIGAGAVVYGVERLWNATFLKSIRGNNAFAFVTATLLGAIAYGVGVGRMLYYSQPILEVSSINEIDKNYFSDEGYYFYIMSEPLIVDATHRGIRYYVTTDDDGDETEHYYETYRTIDSIGGKYTHVLLGFDYERRWSESVVSGDKKIVACKKNSTYHVVSGNNWNLSAYDLNETICVKEPIACNTLRSGADYKIITQEDVDPYEKRILYRTLATVFVIIGNIVLLVEGIMLIKK